MARSELTVDLGAIRRNVRTLLRALEGAELWAVVKADGYGHGAVDVAGAALGAGATALCAATVPEALVLRQAFGPVRILASSVLPRAARSPRRGTQVWSSRSRTARFPRACART